MNLLEFIVVLACITLLIFLLLPALLAPRAMRYSPRISCVNNLKQVGLAYRVWAGDNNDKYPMDVSVTNGGAKELIGTGNVLATYLCMSNELSTPKILFCPADENGTQTFSFATNLTTKNISYFIGVNVNESQPQGILSGDDNLQIAGSPLSTGLNTLATNSSLTWTKARHYREYHHTCGNVGLADGSALQATDQGLQEALQNSVSGTTNTFNLIAIP